MSDPAEQAGSDLVDRLVAFGSALRLHGLPVGTDDVLTFCTGVGELTPSDQRDVYWCGRATLVHRRDHIAIYDEVFTQFFSGLIPPERKPSRQKRNAPQGSTGVLNIPDSEPGIESGDERPMILGLEASSIDIQRTKRFSACTPDELAAVRRIIAKTRLNPPKRRTRRRSADPSGPRLDIRRMARDNMRMADTSPGLLRLDRKERARPVVLILDISGSMADHSRNLLQFAYSMRRAAQKVEVFCFGSRLTRLTAALDRRNPDAAMQLAAERVVDWDGGTRIGESLDSFVRNWGRRGLSRGATVVICSDGLDRGDPALLADAIERLQRLSYRIIWVNPLHDASAVRPNTLAMAVVEPWVDEITSGHNLASLEAFASRLASVR